MKRRQGSTFRHAVAPDQVGAATVVAVALRRQGAGWLLHAGIALNAAGQLVRRVRRPRLVVAAASAVITPLLVGLDRSADGGEGGRTPRLPL